MVWGNKRSMVKLGRYRHYKGKEYEVIGCAKHSETEEEFVVYKALYGEGGLWVRPIGMFLESVMVGVKSVRGKIAGDFDGSLGLGQTGNDLL